MCNMLLLTLLCISVSELIVNADNLCDSCKCTEHDEFTQMVNVICEDRNLQSVPLVETWPVNPYTLDLSRNNITSITYLEYNNVIQALDLDNTHLQFIEPNVFRSYPNLIYLDLSENYLTSLNKSTFDGLENLMALNISYNNMKTLPESIFDPLVKLEELRLAGNPLRYLQANIFQFVLSIKYIDISDIKAHTLPDGIFHTLDSLECLDLSRNDFSEIPSSALRSSPKLKELKFNENPITELNGNSFKYLSELQVLDLNDLTKFKKVKELTFASLHSLNTLRMSSNPRLQYIDPLAFVGIYNHAQISSLRLKVVKLRNNDLSTLNRNMLPWQAIPILDLQGNPWHCDCYLSWIINCSIPAELSSDFRCQSPRQNAGKLVKNVKIEEFVCLHEAEPQYSEALIRTVAALVGLAGILIVAIATILVIKRKHIRSWWIFRKRGTGAVYYVKAHTNPNDAIDL